MTDSLVVPDSVNLVIELFDQSTAAFNENDVLQAIIEARTALASPTDAEAFGGWSEVLAFSLAPAVDGGSPWRTYFGPSTYGRRETGEEEYLPDISDATPEVLGHWSKRATKLKHPVLTARYADLTWDMSLAIAKFKRDPRFALIAIQAYLKSATSQCRPDITARFNAGLRALDLALMLRDESQVELAKIVILGLHRETVAEKKGPWWIAVDRLLDHKHVALTDLERESVVSDLEAIFSRHSGDADPSVFDPYAAKAAGDKLIKYYRKHGEETEAVRIHIRIAQTFERFASLADPLVSANALQTSVNYYRDGGSTSESKRARTLMEVRIADSHEHLGTFTFERTILKDDMDKFLSELVVDDVGMTFAQIAGAFLTSREALERQLRQAEEVAPLVSRITRTIVADDHIAAKVGSLEEDPHGRLILQAKQSMDLSDIYLVAALQKAIDVHVLTPGHFVGWAARTGVFEDLTLLAQGVTAWFQGDFVKALHVLIPQVEVGLRGIAYKRGQPTTKRHSKVAGVSVALGLGDLLNSEEMTQILGFPVAMHFLALYADPRGFNLRNKIAHGLLQEEEMGYAIASNVIHTLLVFGIWEAIADHRQ